MTVWNFILKNLNQNSPTTLLYVVASNGSSPGREGFHMAVNKEGNFTGTIGGGIMEVKMIELAKAKMDQKDHRPIIKVQYHDKQRARNQSGLICSGDQTVAIIPLAVTDLALIQTIAERTNPLFLEFNKTGFKINHQATASIIKISSETDFTAITKIDPPSVAHVFGAGHVGLALAQQLSFLGYRIFQYDDRPNLPILSQPQWATKIRVINYASVKKELTFRPNDVVILVSFSYRSDKLLLKQLYQQPFAYIGMMGSENKIATLKAELAAEGISPESIHHVFMPIGIPIHSRTAAEIAVSIAGQLIAEANKNLPTGRSHS